MVVSIRRKQRSVLPYRVVLWLIVALGCTVLYFNHSPWFLDSEWETFEGLEITRDLGADIVVVLDYKAIRESGNTFQTQDWSAAWINLIEQEFGPVTIATPESLSERLIAQSRVVILTSSVSDQIGAGLLRQLRQHVRQGNVLVVERPEGELREAFSANGRAGVRRGQQITFARDLAEPFHQQLQSMPLSTDFTGSTAARPNTTTLLSIDGAPVIYALPVGKGTAITVDFDLGEQLVALQQGRPTSQFEVQSTHGPPGTPPRTSDLILDERLKGAKIPYADLLERFIAFGVLNPYANVPAFWGFSGGARGAVILIHEDAELGDGGGWMLEYETSQRAVSTLLTTSDAGLTASGAAIIHRKGGEVGLLWRLAHTPEELREAVGIRQIKPLARPVELGPQIDALKATLPVAVVRTAKVHGGWWSPRWAAPFEAMAKHGVRVDTSYGLETTSGYAFGTGLPFLTFNESGMPIGLREMPVVVPNGALDGPSLEELLTISRDGHHQAIIVSMNPASFADYPDVERFEKWLEMFDQVRVHDHLMTSVIHFDGFQRSRRASSIRSRWIERAPIPEVARSPATAADGHVAQALRVTVEAKARGLHLVVPTTMKDKKFLTAQQGANRIGGEIISGELPTEADSIIGFGLRRIPLEAGFTTIDIFYH